MKILIYGAGIQGSYLAHVLTQNPDNQVTLLARNQRLKQLKQDGLILFHQLQHAQTQDQLNYLETLPVNEYFDLIFITMKYNDFESVLKNLAENVSQNLIFVGNQFDTKGLYAKITSYSATPKKILFGFQTTGGTRKNQQINILRFGSGKLKISTTPELAFVRPLLDAAFEQTPATWQANQNLDDWLKSHGALIAVLNSYDKLRKDRPLAKKELLKITVASYGETFAILKDAQITVRPKVQKFFLSNATIASLLMKILYATPVMSMQEGDFREIEALLLAIKQLQTETQTPAPNFLKLAQLATEK